MISQSARARYVCWLPLPVLNKGYLDMNLVLICHEKKYIYWWWKHLSTIRKMSARTPCPHPRQKYPKLLGLKDKNDGHEKRQRSCDRYRIWDKKTERHKDCSVKRLTALRAHFVIQFSGPGWPNAGSGQLVDVLSSHQPDPNSQPNALLCHVVCLKPRR